MRTYILDREPRPLDVEPAIQLSQHGMSCVQSDRTQTRPSNGSAISSSRRPIFNIRRSVETVASPNGDDGAQRSNFVCVAGVPQERFVALIRKLVTELRWRSAINHGES